VAIRNFPTTLRTPDATGGVRCVAVDKKLQKIDPQVFQFLMDFAKDNDLRIVDCRTLIDEIYPNKFLA
jgi:hypothetical protein